MALGGKTTMRGSVPEFKGVGTAATKLAHDLSRGRDVGVAALDFGASALKKYALGQLPEMERKVKSEQETAGLAHGLAAAKGQTDYTLRDDPNSVGGAAFNKGAQQAYFTSVGMDIRDATDEKRLKFKADPVQFENQFNQYSKGLLDKVPPSLRPHVEMELNSRKSEALRQIKPAYEAKQRGQQKVTVLSGLEGFGRDYENAWRRGDVKSAQEAFDRFSIGTAAALENGLITPESAVARMENLRIEGEKQTVLGEFDRTVESGGIEAGETFIKSFKKSVKDIDPDLKDSIVARLESDVSGFKADARVRDTELAKKTGDVVSVIEKGYEPNGLEALRNEVKGTRYATELDAALADRDYIQAFAKQPPETQDSDLAQLSEKGQTKRSASLLARLEKTAAHAQTALENDAMGHAIDVGAVNAPASIDLSAALEDLMAAAQLRNSAVLKIEEIYKRPALPLTAREMGQLEGLLQTGTAQQKTQILGTLTQGFGEKNVREIARKLAPKQPAFAMAAILSGEDPDTAKQILIGEEVLAADPKLKPKPTDWALHAENYFENAFAHAPRNKTRAIEAALSIYAGEISIEGKPTEAFDPDRFDDALNRVTGGIVEDYHGNKIIPPVRGMNQSDFEKFLDTITEEDLKQFSIGGVLPTYKGGSPVDVEYLLDKATFINYAPGQYRIHLSSGQTLNGGMDNGDFGLSFDQNTVLARLGRAPSTQIARAK